MVIATEPIFKVVVRDPDGETITFCTWQRVEKLIKLADETGCECLVSEVEEN